MFSERNSDKWGELNASHRFHGLCEKNTSEKDAVKNIF